MREIFIQRQEKKELKKKKIDKRKKFEEISPNSLKISFTGCEYEPKVSQLYARIIVKSAKNQCDLAAIIRSVKVFFPTRTNSRAFQIWEKFHFNLPPLKNLCIIRAIR